MNRIFAVFIVLIILFSFVVSAFSAEIDGIYNGIEWDNATAYVLTEGDSNCGVKFGMVRVKFDAENNCVYLCVMFTDPMLTMDNLSAGISVSIENSEDFLLTTASSPKNVDVDKYSIFGAMTVDDNGGATGEIRVGIKTGLPETLSITVRFIDANGEPSNYYPLTIINESYVETTKIEIAPTKDNEDPVYNPGLLTRKPDYAYQTVKPKVTYKNKTTKTTESTTRWTFTDSSMTYVRRTRPRKKTTSPPPVTVIVPAITVYYYEKEVIISHVYISEPNASAVESETSSSVYSSDSAVTEPESKYEKLSVSKGSKYKIASGIAAGVAFIVITLFGAGKVKNSKPD